jgi:hypothetical protein
VFIVEGEKDADALTDRTYVATCNSGGAGNWTPDLNRWLSGKTAYVIPDNDEQGRKHAQQVAENLYGIAREIRIVDLPGLPTRKEPIFQTGWRLLGATRRSSSTSPRRHPLGAIVERAERWKEKYVAHRLCRRAPWQEISRPEIHCPRNPGGRLHAHCWPF